MQKWYLIVLLIIIGNRIIFCQQITFQKIYRSFPQAGNEFIYEVLQTPDKGFLTGNYSLLMKTDSLGQKKWMKNLHTASVLSLAYVHDGGFVATGQTDIIKLNGNYTISWTKNFLNVSSVLYHTIRETNDNGFIIGGNGNYEFLLIKTDSAGIVQWSKTYSSAQILDFEFLALSKDHGFVMSGLIATGIYTDILIVKVDSLGNLQWTKKITSSNATSYFNHIAITSDDGYILAGFRDTHRYLLKIDSLGNKIWMKKYEAGIAGDATWVEETRDHGFTVVGNLEINTAGHSCLLMKTDSIGNVRWNRVFGGYGEVWAGSVKQTEDAGFIIGARAPGGAFSQDFFLIKTDSLGHTNGCMEDTINVTVTNLNDTVTNFLVTENVVNINTVLDTIALSPLGNVLTLCAPVGIEEPQKDQSEIEIYPNPFIDEFKILGFRFDVGEKTKITIYDLMGEKVFEKVLSSTQTEEELNLSFLQQGVYFLNVKSNGESWTRKIVKM